MCLLPPSGFIVLMKEAVNTSETSVNFYKTTGSNIPKDRHLHTCRRKNLKSHLGPFTLPLRNIKHRSVTDRVRLSMTHHTCLCNLTARRTMESSGIPNSDPLCRYRQHVHMMHTNVTSRCSCIHCRT
jgi:hypothetical protein